MCVALEDLDVWSGPTLHVFVSGHAALTQSRGLTDVLTKICSPVVDRNVTIRVFTKICMLALAASNVVSQHGARRHKHLRRPWPRSRGFDTSRRDVGQEAKQCLHEDLHVDTLLRDVCKGAVASSRRSAWRCRYVASRHGQDAWERLYEDLRGTHGCEFLCNLNAKPGNVLMSSRRSAAA